MFEELLGYPVDTTGYMTIRRGIVLVGTLTLMDVAPAQIEDRLLIIVGLPLMVYATYRVLDYSPLME